MGRKIEKSLSWIIESHISIFEDNGSMVGAGASQLDYLRFYVPQESIELYGCPWNNKGVKDNPNWELTDYENVYQLLDYKYCMYQVVLPWVSPISVLRWSKVKVNSVEKIEICIYWKALRLYYAGYISWLRDFVIKYGWECSRADLCWDFDHRLPWEQFQWDCIIDLKKSLIVPNSENTDYDYIGYWKKDSPFFVRIYNKTEDLMRNDKGIHSWLYPDWYKDLCWRLEIQFKGRYSRCATPLEWLDWQSRDCVIDPITQSARNDYKTALYSVINLVKLVNLSDSDKVEILNNGRELITKILKNILGITKKK